MTRTLQRYVVGVVLVATSFVAVPAIAQAAPSAAPTTCSKAFAAQFPVIQSSITDAYAAFNSGHPEKTEPLMKRAIDAARKALPGTTGTGKTLLKRLIAVGVDKYRVSMMTPILVEMQDYQRRGC